MDEQRRRIVQAITPSPCRESGNGPLHKPLQPAVDTGAHRLPTPRQRKRLARNVRSPERQPRRTIHPERRQGPPQGETRRAKRSSRPLPTARSVFGIGKHLHPGTGGLEIRAVQRRAPDRILRHDGKGKAFGPGKASGGSAEINARRRADAFDIAAIRREVEIRLKDFPLAIMVFILKGAGAICANLPESVVVDRPSRSRATCMVIVEPPIRRAPPSIPAEALSRDNGLTPGCR